MAKYIIIGGVAGGATAAARLRRNDEKAEIILIEKNSYISYANCGLPYYIGGVIQGRDNLFVTSPDDFKIKFKIDVRVSQEALSIDKEKKSVTIKNLKTGETYNENYDKLILSPGASPVRPPIPGIDSDRILSLRNVDDTDKIYNFIKKNSVKKATVIGAGFIGLEMAENLAELGINVSIVEMAPQVMNVIDFDMAAIVHEHLKIKNVELYLKKGVTSFKDSTNGLDISLSTGETIKADMVILSIGVKPDTILAKNCGLALGVSGGISVNEYMATDNPDIYAVGDAVEITNPVINKKMMIPLAGPANKQARIAADNIVFGNKSVYKGAIGTAVAKVFDLTIATAGASEKLLDREKIEYESTLVHSNSHAGYYPGATRMALKVHFDKSNGKIFGAQCVGYEGVEKRIDVISAYIQNGGTVFDLEEFEHSYAPPYSSAKDPVNMAGFTAANIINGTVKVIHSKNLANLKDYLMIDVRTSLEAANGMIKGAVNIPFEEIRERLGEIPMDKKIVIYCAVGARGYFVSRILLQNGYKDVYNLAGGYTTYRTFVADQSNENIFDHGSNIPNKMTYSAVTDDSKVISVNACGLSCPGPIVKLREEIELLENGDCLKIEATDPGFYRDVESWCNVTGHCLVKRESDKGKIVALIQKKGEENVNNNNIADSKLGNSKTIVVFSDDFDRALASFVIANGALAMGKKVTMFFTFWGLNVIKKPKKPSVKKGFMGKMFGIMLPSSSKKLKLSKLNMMGMGPVMMRGIMKSQKIESLEGMIDTAVKNGVNIVACQMSMDVMGVKKGELIDAAVIGGVAAYLEKTDEAGMNLFI